MRAAGDRSVIAVGVTVMGGPQLRSAIAVSKAIRKAVPTLPIIWGGAFPTVVPQAAVSSLFVDFAVRGQGEDTFLELLNSLPADPEATFYGISGLSWRHHDQPVHNPDRKFSPRRVLGRMLPHEKLANARRYLDQDVSSGNAHRRLSGGARLPLPVHVLRSRDDVPR